MATELLWRCVYGRNDWPVIPIRETEQGASLSGIAWRYSDDGKVLGHCPMHLGCLGALQIGATYANLANDYRQANLPYPSSDFRSTGHYPGSKRIGQSRR